MSLSYLSILKDGEILAELSTEDSVLIGSAAACDMVLAERGVSREHCRIGVRQGKWFIEDLNSTNGVLLDGVRVSKLAPLPDRCILEVGIVALEIQIDSVMLQTEILEPRSPLPPEATEIFGGLKNKAGFSIGTPKETPPNIQESPMMRADTIQTPNPLISPHKPSIRTPVRNTAANLPPQVLGPYRLNKRIGSGGMGDVYLATHQDAQTVWAIKLLKSDQELSELDRTRFLREMAITTSMQHPALIRCVDCGEHNEQLYIVMEYCNGGNLMDLLNRSGPFTIRRSLKLILRLLEGIAYAHAHGVVHRDLKPSNILLHKDERGRYHPRVSDFGLAKSFIEAGNSGMTVNGTVGGSWAYMPREQFTNFRFVSPQSDVWSMGAILYECLTRKLPRLIQPGADPIRTILESNVVPISQIIPELPKPIAFVLMRSLEKEPIDRFADAEKMRKALSEAAVKSGIEI